MDWFARQVLPKGQGPRPRVTLRLHSTGLSQFTVTVTVTDSGVRTTDNTGNKLTVNQPLTSDDSPHSRLIAVS